MDWVNSVATSMEAWMGYVSWCTRSGAPACEPFWQILMVLGVSIVILTLAWMISWVIVEGPFAPRQESVRHPVRTGNPAWGSMDTMV